MSNSIVLYVSFLHAYFFNDFLFVAHINKFGEAHIELIILTASLILSGFATMKAISMFTKRSIKTV